MFKHHAQIKRQTLHRYWEAVVDLIHDGIMMVDPGSIIVSTNRVFAQMTGYEANEFIGRNCSILKCSRCEVLGQIATCHEKKSAEFQWSSEMQKVHQLVS